MDKRRVISLKHVFFEYLCCMAGGYIIACILPITFLLSCIKMGFIMQSNTTELEANKAAETVREQETLDISKIPETCCYIVADKRYCIIDTNMEEEAQKAAIHYAKDRLGGASARYHFVFIERENEYVLIQYSIGPLYRVKTLNNKLLNPDRICIVCIIVNCIIASFIITTHYARYIKEQLKPLSVIAENIEEQNLRFVVGSSDISEFSDILQSFDDMKENLRISLEAKWEAEKERNIQIMALTHDLKTPLTVIMGNAELLELTDLDREQEECTTYILDSAKQMRLYIQELIEASYVEAAIDTTFHKINTMEFVNNLCGSIAAIVKVKDITPVITKTIEQDSFLGMEDLLRRAVINIVDNAVKYSKEQSEIQVVFEVTEERIQFQVVDSGCGFSSEDLKQAKKKFYMGDNSRNEIGSNHYGIGLYMADLVATRHKGELKLENDERGHGKVTLVLQLLNNKKPS